MVGQACVRASLALVAEYFSSWDTLGSLSACCLQPEGHRLTAGWLRGPDDPRRSHLAIVGADPSWPRDTTHMGRSPGPQGQSYRTLVPGREGVSSDTDFLGRSGRRERPGSQGPHPSLAGNSFLLPGGGRAGRTGRVTAVR